MTDQQLKNSMDRPLTGAAKFSLACAAAASILLFYLFGVAAILVLLVVFALELVLVLGAARFGAAGPVVRMVSAHMAPLPVLFRCFWIRKGAEFRLALREADAPALYVILRRLCERAKVGVPATSRLR